MLDPLNLILLAAAVFVLWRLYGVLGSRTGNERTPFDPFGDRTSPPDATGGALPDIPRQLPGRNEAPAQTAEEERQPVWQGYAAAGSPVARGLELLASADKTFSPQSFLEGAKLAYELIIEAFAKGDKAALKPLLAGEVLDGFSREIDARAARGQVLNTRFIGFRQADMAAAELAGSKASVTVKFIAEMISTTTSASGETIEGDPRKVQEVTDIWTFERDMTSHDPNWKLAATEEPA